ncbi:SGNH/GDSL hydrolase family protein [Legionella saoudiensis]|uniref:SGNH/GDSL hydrolase family protein n=1 Tax=Legionella saoudiensis TaxID=1750561 RepID=UPI000730DA99|nr:SGNH/GDSL hydrolase family protein [Legionella saoudiensis]
MLRQIIGQGKKHMLALMCMVSSAAGMIPHSAQALPFSEISQVYFFGDSLTDSGFNNNYTALMGFPMKAPTFTTLHGYTWSQYVAHDIKGFPLATGPFPTLADKITNNTTPINPVVPYVIPELTGVNYACGGSRTNANPGVDFIWAPSLHQQIQRYLSTTPKHLDPKAIYFVWSGANDLLAVLDSMPLPTPAQLLKVADTTSTQVVNEVATLAARGAKRIVVMSLPNVGSTPYANDLVLETGDPSIPANIKNYSFLFDSFMNQKLGSVQKRHRTKILYFDTYTALDNLIDNAKLGQPTIINGQSFFFTNYNTPVCGTLPAIVCDTTSNGHIFADSVHPTDMAHRALSLEVERRIQMWQ